MFALGGALTRFYTLNNCEDLESSGKIIETISAEFRQLEKSLMQCFEKRIESNYENLRRKLANLKKKWKKDYDFLNCNPRLRRESILQWEFSDTKKNILESNTLESEQDQAFLEDSSLFPESGSERRPSRRPLCGSPAEVSNLLELCDFEFLVREKLQISPLQLRFLKTSVLRNASFRFNLLFSENQRKMGIKELVAYSAKANLLFLVKKSRKIKFGIKFTQNPKSENQTFVFHIYKKSVYPLKAAAKRRPMRFDWEKGLILGENEIVIAEDPFGAEACKCTLRNSFDLARVKYKDGYFGNKGFGVESLLVFELL